MIDTHGQPLTVGNPDFEPQSITQGFLLVRKKDGRCAFTTFDFVNAFDRDFAWAANFSEGYARVDL